MEKKKLPAHAMSGTKTADFTRQHWHLTVSPDVTVEDVLRPDFWAHHVPKLNVPDLIDIVSSDLGLDVQLRVIGKGVGYVQMRPLRVYVRETDHAVEADEVPNLTEADIPAGYVINHAPKTLWRVFTKDPQIEVSRQHISKQHAIQDAIRHANIASGLVQA